MTTHRETPVWKTTVIVSTSLQNHDTVRMLLAQQHRIRSSDSVEPGAFIFPLSVTSDSAAQPTVEESFAKSMKYAPSSKQARELNHAAAYFISFYPLRGTAFLLVDPQDLPEQFEESGVIEKIKKFTQVHRNSFLLLYAPFTGKKELEILSEIQCRFFGSNLRILPVRNNAEVVEGILTIAKATSKPHVDNICERMSLAQTHIIDSSPVWQMLRDKL